MSSTRPKQLERLLAPERRPTIHEFNRRARLISKAFITHIELDEASEDLDQILSDHPRLVIAANHGPTFGPIASSIGMCRYVDEIGHGHRRFFGVTWRGFYRLPVFRELATFMSGSSAVFSVAEYADMLREGPFNDFLVMPEGENCNFGDGFEVQPFLSSGFIDIALRAGVPILIAANQGTETWARTFELGEQVNAPWMGFLPRRWRERVADTGIVSLTNPLRGRISPLRLSFKLYRPQLSLAELPNDRMKRRAMLQLEGVEVHRHLQEMVTRMAAMDALRSEPA